MWGVAAVLHFVISTKYSNQHKNMVQTICVLFCIYLNIPA